MHLDYKKRAYDAIKDQNQVLMQSRVKTKCCMIRGHGAIRAQNVILTPNIRVLFFGFFFLSSSGVTHDP